MANPVGRPSKYDPAFCERVIQLGKLGKSIEQIACELDVGTKTIYNWRDEHPEFLRALDMAREFEQNWWETIAQTHMIEEKDAAKLNASIWSRSMAARFPKKYRESTKQEITGADGAPLLQGIEVSFVTPPKRDE
jgi:Helix-turn-helix domain of resolvase